MYTGVTTWEAYAGVTKFEASAVTKCEASAGVTPPRHSGGRRNPGPPRHSGGNRNPVNYAFRTTTSPCPVSKHPCVYILASRRNGTLYVGVTSDLVKRVWEHRDNLAEGFTKRHGVHTLVWFEQHATMESAIAREKAIKEWKRRWKLDLVEQQNPEWRDLYTDIV